MKQEIKLRASEFEITQDQGAMCVEFLQRLYKSHFSKINQYGDVWLNDQRKAQKNLDTLDQKLEEGTITDVRYKLRAAVHEATIVRTTRLLSDAGQDAKQWLELAIETFSRLINIGDVFENAQDDEQRRLMVFLGSNWTLSNKKVALTPREPLNLLHIGSRNKDWRARPDSNRRSPP
jgi:hypothetical protein